MNNGVKKKKKKQLEQDLKDAQEECSKAFQYALALPQLEEFEKYMEPFDEKVNTLNRELRMIQKPKYESIPPYGDLMTLEDFLESVKEGSFIDYDGHGNYATGKQMTDIIVYPSDLKYNRIRREFTHVVWFNR